MTSNLPAKAEKKRGTLKELLLKNQKTMEMVLPRNMNPERFVRLAYLAIAKTPKLQEATPLSVVNAIATASVLGLEIGRHAHLVPFKTKNGMECVLIPDYRGYQELAIRSGYVRNIEARIVYADERLQVNYGSAPSIVHLPILDQDRLDTEIVAVYAVAFLRGGETTFEVMTRNQVEAIRKRSRAKDDGPWITDFGMMACKTVVKRLCDKRLPQSPELSALVEADNRAETGEIGRADDLLDTEASLSAHVAEQTKDRLEGLKEKLAAPKGDAYEEPEAAGDGQTD